MKLKALVLATLLGTAALPQVLHAEDVPNGPHIVTTGTSSIEAKPDIAKLIIDVSVTANDAISAKQQVDQRVAKYFTFLEQNGITTKDIDAANIRTMPKYTYSNTGKSELKGYIAERQVEVTLHDLDKMNALLDGALKAGLNEIRSIQLGVSDPKPYREEAQRKAIEDAIQQASSVAQGFKNQLGTVYSIRYHVNNTAPMPVMRMYSVAQAPGVADNVGQTYQQESIRFDDQVSVVFNLKQ